MSWIIKASPKVIRTEEDEPEALRVGDRVKFTKNGLDAFSNATRNHRGTVIRVDDDGLVGVQWDDDVYGERRYQPFRCVFPNRVELA